MKPLPARTLTTNSVSMRGSANASNAPARISHAPMRIGVYMPMRSIWRPQRTEQNMGTTASSEISTPTVSGVAPKCSANSEIVTRALANATCGKIVSRNIRPILTAELS